MLIACLSCNGRDSHIRVDVLICVPLNLLLNVVYIIVKKVNVIVQLS